LLKLKNLNRISGANNNTIPCARSNKALVIMIHLILTGSLPVIPWAEKFPERCHEKEGYCQ
jgi:hypothetical protein